MPRSGLAGAMTGYPSRWRRSMTPFQVEHRRRRRGPARRWAWSARRVSVGAKVFVAVRASAVTPISPTAMRRRIDFWCPCRPPGAVNVRLRPRSRVASPSRPYMPGPTAWSGGVQFFVSPAPSSGISATRSASSRRRPSRPAFRTATHRGDVCAASPTTATLMSSSPACGRRRSRGPQPHHEDETSSNSRRARRGECCSRLIGALLAAASQPCRFVRAEGSPA